MANIAKIGFGILPEGENGEIDPDDIGVTEAPADPGEVDEGAENNDLTQE